MKKRQHNLKVGMYAFLLSALAFFTIFTVKDELHGGSCYDPDDPQMCGDPASTPFPRCQKVQFGGGPLGERNDEDGPNEDEGHCGAMFTAPGVQHPWQICGYMYGSQTPDCPPDDDENENET